MLELFIAKKHIFQRKRQSIVAMLGIAIGVIVLVVSIGVANGLNKNMIDSILSITTHVTSKRSGGIENYREVKETIEKLPGVKGAVPKISTQGIIKHSGRYGNYISGVKVEGLDLAAAQKAMDLDKRIIAGKINPENRKGILIGKELYRNLGANIGDPITLVSADSKEMTFNIQGVFQSGYYDYDISMVILPLSTVQYMTYSGDKAEHIDTMAMDPYLADEVSIEISKATGLSSRTWGQMNRNLLSALALEKTVMILVFSLIVVIAGFVVWVILNMLVREKIKDIGIMGSMGFSHRSIMKIFLYQGLILGMLGIVIGVAVALAILWYVKNYSIAGITKIYYLTEIPIAISAKEILIIVGANVGIIFLSSIFPAYRAAKMENVEALRYE
jgi:lipoprotein-releasing system permease protein